MTTNQLVTIEKINKHGLKRPIPNKIKRKIRQQCGFGCVICGDFICDYDHFDPPWVDAMAHNPNGIALLCLKHHGEKTRGILPNELVKEAAKNPMAKHKGFAQYKEWFWISKKITPKIYIGSNYISSLKINGDEIFSVKLPRIFGKPFLINAFICDKNNKKILQIVDNEILTPIDNWDVELSGKKMIIRHSPRNIDLVIRAENQIGEIIIEKINMEHKGTKLSANELEMFIANNNMKIHSAKSEFGSLEIANKRF